MLQVREGCQNDIRKLHEPGLPGHGYANFEQPSRQSEAFRIAEPVTQHLVVHSLEFRVPQQHHEIRHTAGRVPGRQRFVPERVFGGLVSQ